MPMAGRGSRFFENGFVMPKPLIEINDRPFFYWATQSIAKFVDCADITFVVLEEHIRDHAIDREIKTYYPDAKIVALPEVTEGAAITALRGAESLPDDEPLLFNDCDHLFLCKPFNEFCKAGDFANGPDGALLTFASDSPAYSYLQYGADGRVCQRAGADQLQIRAGPPRGRPARCKCRKQKILYNRSGAGTLHRRKHRAAYF